MEPPAAETETSTGSEGKQILATTEAKEEKKDAPVSAAELDDNPMLADKKGADEEVQFFKSSVYPVAPEILDFLKKQTTGIAYNKYCIDCQQKKSTHFVVWTGTFVCKNCAQIHTQMCGDSMRNCYTKCIFRVDDGKQVSHNEHWDDFQLKSVQVGGNKELYEVMKEYDLLKLPMEKKYTHKVIQWFMRRHVAKIDGNVAQWDQQNPKPPHGPVDSSSGTMMQRAQVTMSQTGSVVARNVSEKGKKLTDVSLYYADRANEAMDGLISRTKEKPWAKKLATFFQKKGVPVPVDEHERTASMDEPGLMQESEVLQQHPDEEEKMGEGDKKM